jgi:polysaccharide export outer membrane protein
VKLADTVNNAVYLSGAVAKPGVYSLSPAGTKLLDVVTRAGGLQGVPEDLAVELTRDGQVVQQPLASIIPGTEDDILLQPGDRIRLNKRPRSFTVFGAAGRVSQIAFQSNEMTLAEAVAQAAGPNDATADPTAVFLFRNLPDPANGDRPKRVIYRLNLMDPLGYFVAQEFKMRDKDLIYVANSRSNQATKFVALVGQLFSPVITARALTR